MIEGERGKIRIILGSSWVNVLKEIGLVGFDLWIIKGVLFFCFDFGFNKKVF